MMNQNHLAIVIFFISCYLECCYGMSIILFSSLIRRRGSDRSKEDPNLTFDSLGRLSAVEDSVDMIKKCSPIVVIRSKNSTIASFVANDPESIQYPIIQPLNSICSDNIKILITGVSGDCRYLIKHAKVISLNYTATFESQPRGLYIAKELASFVQLFTFASSRPLCCHAFIIDLQTHQIFQINTAGILTEVLGGVAGSGMDAGEVNLIDSISSNNIITEDIGKLIVNETMNLMLNSNKYNGDENREDLNSMLRKKIKILLSYPDT